MGVYKSIDNPLWQRQPGESSKAFAAFVRYREMGPDRTHRKVGLEMGRSIQNIDQLSTKYKWTTRIKAWDDYLDELKRKTIEKETEEMIKRHIQGSQVLQRALLAPVVALNKKLKEVIDNGGKNDFETMKLKDLLRLSTETARVFGSITDIERKARGQATEINQSDITSGGEILVIKPIATSKQDDEDV